MKPLNKRVQELQRLVGDTIGRFREHIARRRPGLSIPRVFAHVDDDTDLDDAPDSFVTAGIRPRRPLGSSAIELTEPEDDPFVETIAAQHRH